MDKPDSPKIRTIIVDDEPLARQTLRLLLKEDPEIEVIGEYGTGEEAVEAIRCHSPDLLFLDIQMPVMNGFQALDTLDEGARPVTVFVTAYDQYAIRAFEVHALDYLLKPFDDERFEQALERAKAQIRQARVAGFNARLVALMEEYHGLIRSGGGPRPPIGRQPDGDSAESSAPGSGGGANEERGQHKNSGPEVVANEDLDDIADDEERGDISAEGTSAAGTSAGEEEKGAGTVSRGRRGRRFLNRLMIKTAGRVFFLKAEEIDYIEACDYYVRLHSQGKSHLLRETMRALEKKLDPDMFLRIHRSTIVNLDRVRRLQPHSHGEYMVVLNDGTELKLSRNYRERLQAMLMGE